MPDALATGPATVLGASDTPSRQRRPVTSGPAATTVVILGWVLLWWSIVAVTGVSRDFLPSPVEVLRRTIVLTYQPIGAGALATHVGASLVRLLTGFGLAVAIGVPLGLLMASFRPVNWIVSPIFELFRYVPPIAWAPFAIFWFGSGNAAQGYVIFTAAFPPILLNTFRGVQLVDRRLVAAAKTLGANPFVLMTEVALPSALPVIVTGLRIGLAAGWMALIAAEIVAGTGSRDGLGYLILQGQQQLQADLTIGAMLVIGLLGTVIDLLLRALEGRVLKWRH